MINNKYGWELLHQQERAFAEAYAEDMDNWSALREEEDSWVRNDAGDWLRRRHEGTVPRLVEKCRV